MKGRRKRERNAGMVTAMTILAMRMILWLKRIAVGRFVGWG